MRCYNAGVVENALMNFVSLVAGLVVVCAGMFEAGLAIGHQRIIPAVVAAELRAPVRHVSVCPLGLRERRAWRT